VNRARFRGAIGLLLVITNIDCGGTYRDDDAGSDSALDGTMSDGESGDDRNVLDGSDTGSPGKFTACNADSSPCLAGSPYCDTTTGMLVMSGPYCCKPNAACPISHGWNNNFVSDCEPANTFLREEALCLCESAANLYMGKCDSPACSDAICWSTANSCSCWGYNGSSRGKVLQGNGPCSGCPPPIGSWN